MEKTGNILKVEREKKGISLHEVGMSLKINPKTLQAIEDGDLSKLPARTFLRGFIKSYAQYLKLDSAMVLQTFSEDLGEKPQSIIENTIDQKNQIEKISTPAGFSNKTEITPIITTNKEDSSIQNQIELTNQKNLDGNAFTENSSKSEKYISQDEKNKNSDFKAIQTANENSDQKIYYILIGIILVSAVIVTNKLINKYQREKFIDSNIQAFEKTPDIGSNVSDSDVKSNTPIDSEKNEVQSLINPQPENLISKNEPLESSKKLIDENKIKAEQGKSEISNNLKVDNKTEVDLKQSSSTTTNIEKKPQEMQIPIKKEEKKIDEANAKKNNETAEEKQSVTASKPIEVIVEALNNVKIQYTLGDGKINSLEMSADQIHAFKSKSNIELEVSDGGSINVIVNGREKGVPGTIGKSIKLNYPK